MDPRLLVHTIAYLIATAISLSFAIFVLYKHYKKPTHFVFFLMSLSVAVFQISHVLGTIVSDHNLSRQIFMFNLSNVFIGIFLAHWILLMAGSAHRYKSFLIFIYIVGLAFIGIAIYDPYLFLLDSVSKMYFPNYYVPGVLDGLMRVLFPIMLPAIATAELIFQYFKSVDFLQKNRFRYVLAGVIWGATVGQFAVPLVYNIQIDPVWASTFSFYAVILSYAILKFDLMDIRIIAKRALIYSILVAFGSFSLSILNFSNQWILDSFPVFPRWLLPFISSLVAVGFGISVWNKMRQADVLKYEFITVVTHKFRTPLTHIKWATDEIINELPEQNEEIRRIKKSSERLVELTNLLVELSEGSSMYLYSLKPVSAHVLLSDIEKEYKERSREKKITFNSQIDENVVVMADNSKFKSVIQILLDNAFTYTPLGGEISLFVRLEKKQAIFEVIDNGIGISKNDLPHVFSQFYRTKEAKHADTEGMGVGLYIAKNIVTRHNGTISIFSEGEGKGTKFTVTLPLGPK